MIKVHLKLLGLRLAYLTLCLILTGLCLWAHRQTLLQVVVELILGDRALNLTVVRLGELLDSYVTLLWAALLWVAYLLVALEYQILRRIGNPSHPRPYGRLATVLGYHLAFFELLPGAVEFLMDGLGDPTLPTAQLQIYELVTSVLGLQLKLFAALVILAQLWAFLASHPGTRALILGHRRLVLFAGLLIGVLVTPADPMALGLFLTLWVLGTELTVIRALFLEKARSLR